MHTCESTLHGYKCLDSHIRQEHIILETGEV